MKMTIFKAVILCLHITLHRYCEAFSDTAIVNYQNNYNYTYNYYNYNNNNDRNNGNNQTERNEMHLSSPRNRTGKFLFDMLFGIESEISNAFSNLDGGDSDYDENVSLKICDCGMYFRH